MNKTAWDALLCSVISVVLLLLIGFLFQKYVFEFSLQMLALGALASWWNSVGLGSAWVLYFDKKRVALAFAVIISKYAFLMLIIYWILQVAGSDLTSASNSGANHADSTNNSAAVALGFVGYLILLSVLIAIRNETAKKDT